MKNFKKSFKNIDKVKNDSIDKRIEKELKCNVEKHKIKEGPFAGITVRTVTPKR